MKAVIMQPTYLPWVGLFDLIDQSDVFVFLDNVQFEKQSWQQRNKIKTPQGWIWLTVPVLQSLGQKINEVKINNNSNWKEKHLKSIQYNYDKAPYFKKYFKFFEETYNTNWECLADLNIHIIKWTSDQLNIKNKFVNSSSMNIKGRKTELLVDICKKLNADAYLSPLGSVMYIEENNLFERDGIKLEYQHFEHPIYKQLWGDFMPYMSVIDLLFNEGPKSRTIIRSGRKKSYISEEARKTRNELGVVLSNAN